MPFGFSFWANPALSPGGDEDYTIMPVCLGFPYNGFKPLTAEDFKKCEYMFFLGAELCRLVYSDVVVIQESIKALGMSPDVLNGVISAYDNKYFRSKRKNGMFGPAPETYTNINICAASPEKPLIRYISSPTDTTCMVVNPSAIQPNKYSIFQPTDAILVFKGSSSIRNWGKNVGSLKAFMVNDALSKSGLGVSASRDLKIATSFLEPVLEITQNILYAMNTVTPGAKRLFIFGHSKGGAECEVTGMLFALLLKNKPSQIASLEQVHMVSYGAPKVVASSSLDDFNKLVFLDNLGNITLTRIESVGRLVGDTVTTLPPAAVHPGFTNTSNTLDELRKKYAGVTGDGNYRRNAETWPFPEHPFDMWDRKEDVKQAVEKVIGGPIPPPPPEADTAPLLGGAYASNYVKAKGSKWAPFSHVEQFGMFFLGSQRLPGMKNPANTTDKRTFMSDISLTCSTPSYVEWKPLRGQAATEDAERDDDEAPPRISEKQKGDIKRNILFLGLERTSKRRCRRG